MSNLSIETVMFPNIRVIIEDTDKPYHGTVAGILH